MLTILRKDCPYWQSIEDFYLYMQRFNKNLKTLQMTLDPIQHISRLALLHFKILLKFPFLKIANDARAGGPAEGAHLHIVHLSDARSSLDLIKVLKMATDAGHQVVGSFLSESLQQQFSMHLASVMRILNVMQASTLDYQFIIQPLLKSFMRELFEVLVDKDKRRRQMLLEKHFYQRLNWKPRRRKILSPRKRIKIRERIRIQRLLKVMTCMYRKRKLKNQFTFLLATMVIILVL
ncbi:hypothetical protein CsSME_00003376 [Camellia sinensis var. sinensis]